MAATILGITFLVITCAAESSKVGQVEMLLVIRLCLFQNSPASFPTVPIRRAGPGGHSNNRGWNVSFLAPAAGVPSARQEGVGRSGGSHSYNYNKRCYWAFWKEVHSGESWDTQPWCDRQWHWVTWTVKSNTPSILSFYNCSASTSLSFPVCTSSYITLRVEILFPLHVWFWLFSHTSWFLPILVEETSMLYVWGLKS